jgi:transposase
MKYYVGLDSLATTICAVAEDGAIIREGVAASDPDEIANWLDRLGLAFERVRLETGSTAAWLYSGLRERGVPAVCIDPRRLRAVTKTMRIKNDRNDARAIAHCMRVGWYSVVHVKSEVSQVA